MIKAQPLQWTPEIVARFWDYMATREEIGSEYFTKQVGSGVVKFLSYVVPLKDKYVLDYGCGPGFLIPHLLKYGTIVSAVDYSEAFVRAVNHLFHEQPNWKGAKLAHGFELPWRSGTFDVICCVETIEHILPEHLDSVFHEIHRLLKPGAEVLFTTPNDEKLERSFIFCPNCGSEFHRWQHLRKWSEKTLRLKLEEHGYQVLFCCGLNFLNFQKDTSPSWRDMSLRDAQALLKQSGRRLLDCLNPKPFPFGRVFQQLVNTSYSPHLVAVAKKQSL